MDVWIQGDNADLQRRGDNLDEIRSIPAETLFFFDALLCSIRLIEPELPVWRFRKRVLEYVNVVSGDNFGNLSVHRMHPLHVIRKKGVKFYIRYFGMPVFKWGQVPGLTVVMYRTIKNDLAGKTAWKSVAESVSGHNHKG